MQKKKKITNWIDLKFARLKIYCYRNNHKTNAYLSTHTQSHARNIVIMAEAC